MFFYLSRNPTAYEKLSSEIRSTFRSGAEIQSGPLLSSCTYLRAVIDEAMRISPPISGTLWRELPVDSSGARQEPLVVDGHLIPAGTWVGVNMYTIHHNEEYFPEPFVFKPERWLGENTTEEVKARETLRDAFSPFGIGSRSCIGKVMAYMELNLTLAKTLWYFDFERPRDPILANIGGGMGDMAGRHRAEEFQIFDQFISDHRGPCLSFKPRTESWKDLV